MHSRKGDRAPIQEQQAPEGIVFAGVPNVVRREFNLGAARLYRATA